ncbi:uncharacterized protein [Chlorocebus sabaeus]|uniref:uncharacterized protein isoform X2 n=1 Tax=Chlorocebus sabaeus TaxID=60711 RepID=UPI003BF99E99
MGLRAGAAGRNAIPLREAVAGAQQAGGLWSFRADFFDIRMVITHTKALHPSRPVTFVTNSNYVADKRTQGLTLLP